MELIRGDVKVELEFIGEGVSGDYSPSDPHDEPLMRFTVYGRPGDHTWPGLEWGSPNEDGWHAFSDASYCTNIRDDLPESKKAEYLSQIMDEVYPDASTGKSIKRLCEKLSWIG